MASLKEELRMLGMTYIVCDTLGGYVILAIKHTYHTLRFIAQLLERCQ